MNSEAIREMNEQDLQEEILGLEKELMHLRLGNSIGTVENPLQIRSKRRNLARMKTILRERQLGIQRTSGRD